MAQRVRRIHGDGKTRRFDLIDPFVSVELIGRDPTARAALIQHRDPVDVLSRHHRARVRAGRADVNRRARLQLGRGHRNQRETLQAAIGAEEFEHEVIGRIGEHVDGWAVLLELATHVEHRHTVAQANGFVDVVGDEHDRLLQPALEIQQLLLQAEADDRVDRTERFVHQ